MNPPDAAAESARDPGASPPVARRRRGLTSRDGAAVARAVRGGLADTIRALEAGAPADGTLDPTRANALVYAFSAVAAVARDERLEALEREVSELRQAVEGMARRG